MEELEKWTIAMIDQRIEELRIKADAFAQVFGPNDETVKKFDEQVRQAQMNLLDLLTVSQKVWALKNHPPVKNEIL